MIRNRTEKTKNLASHIVADGCYTEHGEGKASLAREQ